VASKSAFHFALRIMASFRRVEPSRFPHRLVRAFVHLVTEIQGSPGLVLIEPGKPGP
jgi:hypothetical protein